MECESPECSQPGIKCCAKCLCTFYCTRTCQVRHWPDHKKQCGEWQHNDRGRSNMRRYKLLCRYILDNQALRNIFLDLSRTRFERINDRGAIRIDIGSSGAGSLPRDVLHTHLGGPEGQTDQFVYKFVRDTDSRVVKHTDTLKHVAAYDPGTECLLWFCVDVAATTAEEDACLHMCCVKLVSTPSP